MNEVVHITVGLEDKHVTRVVDLLRLWLVLNSSMLAPTYFATLRFLCYEDQCFSMPVFENEPCAAGVP